MIPWVSIVFWIFLPGIDGGGLRREWLTILCTKFFQNNPKGLFSSLGNSRLVHPNPVHCRSSYWKLYHYHLAGNIVGKCMFETACGESYKQMVNGRFSRSFLAQIIGLQPSYRVKFINFSIVLALEIFLWPRVRNVLLCLTWGRFQILKSV